MGRKSGSGFGNGERDEHRDFIIRRLLQRGSWDSIQWLRRQIGDPALRAWIIAHAVRGLEARQLRFWEVVLDLPHEQVDRWVESVPTAFGAGGCRDERLSSGSLDKTILSPPGPQSGDTLHPSSILIHPSFFRTFPW